MNSKRLVLTLVALGMALGLVAGAHIVVQAVAEGHGGLADSARDSCVSCH